MKKITKIVFATIVLLILVLIKFKIRNESKQGHDIIREKSLKEYEIASIRPVNGILSSNDQKLFFLSKTANISICDNELIKNILLITSHPANHNIRSSIRHIFTHPLQKYHSTNVIFLLGHIRHHQDEIRAESDKFGDILQGNFADTIHNATYKHLMGLSWASNNCKRINYLIKINDDIVVNMFKIPAFLYDITERRSNRQSSDFLAGFIKKELSGELRADLNPSYLSGCFYVTTPETARRLVETATQMKYFWRDDAFITGVVAKRLGIKLVELDVHLFAPHPVHLICCMDDTWIGNIECEFLVGPSYGNANLFMQFNLMMAKCVTLETKCVKRKRNQKFIETCDFLRFMKKRGISLERRLFPPLSSEIIGRSK